MRKPNLVRGYYDMNDILNSGDISMLKKIDNNYNIQTNAEKSGWDKFPSEVSFFLVDFCKKQLTPIQNIIFYAYYINGMTLKDISERLYGLEQQNKFSKEEECDEDDEKCDDNFHSSHQAVHKQIVNIEKKLRYSWKYKNKWSDNIITKKRNGKKIRIFNPNSNKEK